MNRSEFVDAVSSRVDVPKATSQMVIDAALATIQDALADGHEVILPGFGKFAVTNRAERTGRNPRTGAPMVIRASQYPRFTAGATLRRAIQADAAPATKAAPVHAKPSAPTATTAVKDADEVSTSKESKKDRKSKKKGKKKK